MFLRGVLQTLRSQRLQGADHTETRVARLDHVVDIAVACGVVGVGELVVVLLLLLGDELRLLLRFVGQLLQLLAVMGASGAVEVLYGKEVAAIESPEEKARFVAEKEKEYNDKFSNPYNAARYGYIDDVIEPRNTRFRIIRALQSLATKRLQNPAKKHSNIPL